MQFAVTKPTVIVTGSKGFIGSHLQDALIIRGHEVIGVDLPENDIRTKCHSFNGVDTVFHLAGLSNIIPSVSDPVSYFDTNVTGTLNVLEAARAAGVRKFIYAASASCYGNEPWQICDESDECNPVYPYALTKYMGEQLVMHWGKVYGIEVVSMRIFNAYGYRSLTKNSYGAMFNTFLAQKANGKPLTIVGDGTQSRDFVYVTDVVEAFILAAEKGVGIYNLGTGKATTINHIAKLIGGEVVYIPERGGEPHTIYADNTRLINLGWKPKVSIEQGLEKMMDSLEYWKEAKIWEPDTIAEETKTWQRLLA